MDAALPLHRSPRTIVRLHTGYYATFYRNHGTDTQRFANGTQGLPACGNRNMPILVRIMNKYGKANQRRHRRIERGNRMPERIAYEPPSGVELEWFSCYYNPHVTIFHRLKRYRGMVAAFTLQVRETDDSQQSMHCIFRYDMAMPEPDLHQHELHPGGDNTGERRIIETIPDDGTGLVFVDKAYKRLADDMVRIAGQQYERWCSEK